jgi:hypothetical protein
MKAWIVVLVSVLAACASSADPSQATLRSERLRSWETLCESRGFTRGTPDFRDCVMGYDAAAGGPPVK